MSNEMDRMRDNNEHITEMNIASIRKEAAKTEAPVTGSCLYCGEGLTGKARWCDQDCRDDWEAERRAKEQRPRGGY